MKFVDLRLAEPILRAVASAGYTIATPVQAQAIPHVLAGRDLLGCAQTGTGKTAAFALPILHRLAAGPAPAGRARVRTLVLCPTRELATQIAGDCKTYGQNLKFRVAVIFGGVNQHHQVQALRQGIDILVATPGRLLDLIDQGHCDLRGVETLVLDEADRMLDMGFIHDIRKIVGRLPAQRQTLLFSATMPTEIKRLAESLLRNPVGVQIAPTSSTAEGIKESVYFVEKRNKPALLAHLVENLPMSRAIVFTRTKHGADRVVRQLHGYGIRSEAIHGNKSQNARQRALENFRASKIPVLVATDIASRGIDINDVSHVVNFDISHEPETYIHRIGRTARAGASGAAVSLCDREELGNLKGIEKLIRRAIPVKTDHPAYTAAAPVEIHSGGRGQSGHGERRGGPASRHSLGGHSHGGHSHGAPSHSHGSARQSQGGAGRPQQAAAPARRGAFVGQGVVSGHSRPVGNRSHAAAAPARKFQHQGAAPIHSHGPVAHPRHGGGHRKGTPSHPLARR